MKERHMYYAAYSYARVSVALSQRSVKLKRMFCTLLFLVASDTLCTRGIKVSNNFPNSWITTEEKIPCLKTTCLSLSFDFVRSSTRLLTKVTNQHGLLLTVLLISDSFKEIKRSLINPLNFRIQQNNNWKTIQTNKINEIIAKILVLLEMSRSAAIPYG